MMFSTGRKHDAHLQNRDERLDITVSGCQKDQRAPCGLQETAGQRAYSHLHGGDRGGESQILQVAGY